MTNNIMDFWSTLITDKGLSPHVESLMAVSDLEERGLSLMSRVNFLWCMGIKYQRDIIMNILLSVNKVLSMENDCNRKCRLCSKIKLLINKNSGILEEIKGMNNKSNNLRDNDTCSEKSDTVERIMTEKDTIDTLSGESIMEILAPDTEKFPQAVRNPENENVIIPETIELDKELYDCTNIFIHSPLSESAKASPILGKSVKGNTTPVPSKAKRVLNMRSPTKNDDLTSHNLNSDLSTDSLSLLGCNLLEKRDTACSDQSNSPLKTEQNLDRSKKYVPLTENIVSPKKRLSKFSKSKSEVVPITKNLKATRYQSLSSCKNSKLNLEIEVTSPDPKRKKYHQTKLTASNFFKKKNAQENYGMTEQLQTEEVEPLQKDEKTLIKSNSIRQLDNIRKKRHLKKNSTSFLSSSNNTDHERNLDDDKCIGTQLTEDQILADLKVEAPSSAIQDKCGGRLKRNRKKPLIHDSFDILPDAQEPEFAYVGAVARKRTEKKCLDGWDCLECRDYYEGRETSEAERKELKNKCSRHRSRHKPVTNTPAGFWNVDFDDDDN